MVAAQGQRGADVITTHTTAPSEDTQGRCPPSQGGGTHQSPRGCSSEHCPAPAQHLTVSRPGESLYVLITAT